MKVNVKGKYVGNAVQQFVWSELPKDLGASGSLFAAAQLHVSAIAPFEYLNQKKGAIHSFAATLHT